MRTALIVLWEAADRICGKRLAALLPVLIPAMERHGHLSLDATVREKLLAVSPATIDRMLAPSKTGRRKRRSQNPAALKKRIPVRTFTGWDDPPPGHMEIDLVAHCGGTLTGNSVHTLTLTDIASGWTECVALPARDSSFVIEAIDQLRPRLPFPLRGIDTDNGSEFINEALLAYAGRCGIEFTRSRPYRKNDQAWVEQKNGAVVRRLVGYGRLDGLAATSALRRMYDSARIFVNFFQPSFKLLSKRRDGARIRKRYLRPATPSSRLLELPEITDTSKDRLRAVAVTSDPLRLLEEIRSLQRHLAGLTKGDHSYAPEHRDTDLEAFLRSFAFAWKSGEVRPTHQADPKPPRNWRTRKDPFAGVWPTIVVWLETEPDVGANVLLTRLQEEFPCEYPPGTLRTLQRRIKVWRTAAARKLVLGSGASFGVTSDEASGNVPG